MAASMNSRLFVSVLCVIVFVLLVVVSSEARLSPPSFSTKGDKKIDSESWLRELIKIFRKSEYYDLQKRSMLGQNGMLERVSPTGPDSQHH